MSKFATQADYWKAKVQAVHPEAYLYTPAPNTWRVNIRVNGIGYPRTLGEGNTETRAWKNAAKLSSAAIDESSKGKP